MITEMIIVGAIRKKMGLPPLKFFNVSPPSEGTNVLLASVRAKEEQSSTPEPRVASGASSASSPDRGLPAWLPGLRSRASPQPSTGAWSPLSAPFNLVHGASYCAAIDIGPDGRTALTFGYDDKVKDTIRERLQAAGFSSVQITSLTPSGARVTGTWTGPSKNGALPSAVTQAWVDPSTLPATTTNVPASAQTPATTRVTAPSNPYGRRAPTPVPTPHIPVDVTQKPDWIVPVKAVQQALIRRGFLGATDPNTNKPSDDGWRGNATDAAVRNFQTYASLPVNGIVDARFMQLVTAPTPSPGPGQRPVPRAPRPPRRTSPNGTPAPQPAPTGVLDQDPTHPPPGDKDAKPSFLDSLKGVVTENPWAAGAIALAAVSVAALSLAPSPTAIVLQRS